MSTNDLGPIMVPLDGSALSEHAIPLAASLARSRACPIHLVYVTELNLWPDELSDLTAISAIRRILHADGETYLREIRLRYQAPGLTIDTTVLSSDMQDIGLLLVQQAVKLGAGLVVMASHGRGGLKRAWIGSVADHLIRHLPVPVLVTHPGQVPAPTADRILVPLDGSALAESAIDEACALALLRNEELVLLRIISPVVQAIGALEAPVLGYNMELTATLRAAADDYLAELTERVRGRGIKCTSLTMLAANPAQAIIEVARPVHYTTIIMATHGRGGLQRVVLGSVADKVVRGAEVPVLVVRVGTARSPRPPQAAASCEVAPASCAI